MFSSWLESDNPQPYGSFGKGSTMRVSSAGWMYETIEETRHYARLTAKVTHNHLEGIKRAEATASAIFMARNGESKDEIKEYIIQEFGYDLSRTCDEIRPTYHHVETCQKTVPEVITAFLEGTDFEDVIRTAVSLGGDSDTLTCIAGGIAEAFYGVPEELKDECRKRLKKDMLAVLDRFDKDFRLTRQEDQDPFLEGNDVIEEAILRYRDDSTKDNLIAVLDAIRTRCIRTVTSWCRLWPRRTVSTLICARSAQKIGRNGLSLSHLQRNIKKASRARSSPISLMRQ